MQLCGRTLFDGLYFVCSFCCFWEEAADKPEDCDFQTLFYVICLPVLFSKKKMNSCNDIMCC